MRFGGFLFCVVGVALTTSACGQIDTYEVVTGTPAAPHDAPVSIFSEEEGVPPGVTEVALIQAIGSGNLATVPSVIEKLQQMAQRLGCNAVIRLRVDSGGSMVAGFGVAVQMPSNLAQRNSLVHPEIPVPPPSYLGGSR